MNTSQSSESSVLQAVRVLYVQLDPGVVLVYNEVIPKLVAISPWDKYIPNTIGGTSTDG